jgi:hypothetical protein
MVNDTEKAIGEPERLLIDEITRAFEGVQRSTGISWREAEEIDCHGSEIQRQLARFQDKDICWQDVSGELFDQLPSAVHFLDARGLFYYLPAFMVSDIHRAGKWESAVADGFLDILKDSVRLEILLPLLDENQKRAICHWIDLFCRR